MEQVVVSLKGFFPLKSALNVLYHGLLKVSFAESEVAVGTH